MLAHLQIHRKGYVSSIDNLPLTLNMSPKAVKRISGSLKKDPDVEAFSPRLKLGAMVSNYQVTTNIRLNGIDPAREQKTVPALITRVKGLPAGAELLARGQVILPEVIAQGLNLKKGDEVVLVATNKNGSVNGLPLTVAGIIVGVQGPGGRDGYMHLEDASQLLRLEEPEISEIAVRLKGLGRLDQASARLSADLGQVKNQKGKPAFELHTWAQLSPFANFARLIDLLTVFIKVMLIGVVLVSVLNVMMMSVYERIREIGALAAIGTTPGKIAGLFLTEGFLMGFISSIIGALLGGGVIWLLNLTGLSFTFGRNREIFLTPTVSWGDLLIPALIVIIVSALASLQPAYKASRLEPVEALRHV
jgi:putative ABC transport system permease protein